MRMNDVMNPLHDKAPMIDEPAALAALDGSRELLSDLAQMFCEDAPVVLEEMNSALQVNNAAGTRRAIHSIKGLASTFFAKPTIELAQRLEEEAAQQKLDSIRSGGARQLQESVARLRAELVARGLAHYS